MWLLLTHAFVLVPLTLICVLVAFNFTHFTTLFWVGSLGFNGGENVGFNGSGAATENNGGEWHVRS